LTARLRIAVGALAAVLSCLGCQSDASRAERGRIAQLAERIDRLRRADNPDKGRLLDDLRKTECVGPDACGLKDLCVRAYEVHQRALDAIGAMKSASASDAGASAPLRARLLETERDLRAAKDLSVECADEQVRAVRKTLL
jgi:hypothetical protein